MTKVFDLCIRVIDRIFLVKTEIYLSELQKIMNSVDFTINESVGKNVCLNLLFK